MKNKMGISDEGFNRIARHVMGQDIEETQELEEEIMYGDENKLRSTPVTILPFIRNWSRSNEEWSKIYEPGKKLRIPKREEEYTDAIDVCVVFDRREDALQWFESGNEPPRGLFMSYDDKKFLKSLKDTNVGDASDNYEVVFYLGDNEKIRNYFIEHEQLQGDDFYDDIGL